MLFRSWEADPPYDSASSKPISILIEVLSGLQLYFDRALGANLLYRFERTQYVEQRRKHQEAAGGSGSGEDFEASKIYGAEHLLRLFGQSRPLLPQQLRLARPAI